MPKEKEILADLIEERSMLGKPASLSVRFLYHHQTSSASTRKIMGRGNNRMQEFYYRLWFVDKVPLDAAVIDVFDGRGAQDSGQAIAHFPHAAENDGNPPPEDCLRTHGSDPP